MNERDDVKAIEELALRASKPVDLGDGRIGIIVPDGCSLRTWYGTESINETVIMADVDSFVRYVSDFRTETTRIFAPRAADNGDDALRVVAEIDWHGRDGWRPAGHRCVLEMPRSEQFSDWEVVCSEGRITQKAFADFIEQHDVDIVEPDSAKLLDVVMNFRRVSSVRYGSSIRLDNGDFSIEYSENSGVKGSVKVPSKIVIGIPIFRGDGSKWEIGISLRHRISDGKLYFSMEMLRRNETIMIAEDYVFDTIREKLSDIPFHVGRVMMKH